MIEAEVIQLTDTDYREAAGRLFKAQKIDGYEPKALHLYRDAEGHLIYGRVRMHKPKEGGGYEKLIRPFWHNGTDWKHGEPKQEGGKVLYGLPDLIAHPAVPVYVVEGEQKADALTKIGAGQLVGVTSGGCTSAGGTDWSPLAGRHVVLWPDHDAPGAKYADEVAAKLEPLGCTVERLYVAALGLPDKGDVMDWLTIQRAAWDRVPSADEVLMLPMVGATPESQRKPETSPASRAMARLREIKPACGDGIPAATVPANGDVAGDAASEQLIADLPAEPVPAAVDQPASDAPADDLPDETDDSVIKRLAALKPMEYDRVRKAEAARLKVRPATLDLMVREARGEGGGEEVALFDEVEPWHEPVDGAALLSEVARTIRRFIVCDPETVTATALWCVTAWLVDHVSTCPILLINAPEKACGKTQLLTVTGELVPRAAQAAGISSSVLFRMIERYKPTLLVDEIETVLTKEAEDLRGILNAGHTRPSAYIWRSVPVGDDFEPKRFSVFGFKALAGINADRLAETITSRSVIAALRRKLPHETVERLRHAEAGLFDRLKAKIARWTEDNADAIRAARPELPDELGDRDQDNWEPLLAVADLAGGTWPAWSRKAALKLCSHGEQSAQSAGAELLADIQEVFETRKAQRISMADLLNALLADEEKPWASWRGGRPMTPRSLGKILSEYGIKSKAVRIGYESPKGFEVDQFADAFARYLSSSPVTPLSSVTRSQTNAGAGLSVTEAQSRDRTKNPSVTLEPLSDKACDRVTEENGVEAEKEKSLTDDDDGEAV